MYRDPRLIRKHVVKLNLNDEEAELVDALVEFEGGEKSRLLRRVLMDHVRKTLALHDANFDVAEAPMQRPN